MICTAFVDPWPLPRSYRPMVTASGDGGSSWVDRLDLTAGAHTLVIIAGQVRMAKSERRSLPRAWAYWWKCCAHMRKRRADSAVAVPISSTSSCRYWLAIVVVDNAMVHLPQAVAGRPGVPHRSGRQLHLDASFRRSGRVHRRPERQRGRYRDHYQELWPRPAVGGAVSRLGGPRCHGRSRPILPLPCAGLGTDPRPVAGHSDTWPDRPFYRAVGRPAARHSGGGA